MTVREVDLHLWLQVGGLVVGKTVSADMDLFFGWMVIGLTSNPLSYTWDKSRHVIFQSDNVLWEDQGLPTNNANNEIQLLCLKGVDENIDTGVLLQLSIFVRKPHSNSFHFFVPKPLVFPI